MTGFQRELRPADSRRATEAAARRRDRDPLRDSAATFEGDTRVRSIVIILLKREILKESHSSILVVYTLIIGQSKPCVYIDRNYSTTNDVEQLESTQRAQTSAKTKISRGIFSWGSRHGTPLLAVVLQGHRVWRRWTEHIRLPISVLY